MIDAARYNNYILSLVFYKRLYDVYVYKLARVARSLELDIASTKGLVTVGRSLVHFYLPATVHWTQISKQTSGLDD